VNTAYTFSVQILPYFPCTDCLDVTSGRLDGSDSLVTVTRGSVDNRGDSGVTVYDTLGKESLEGAATQSLANDILGLAGHFSVADVVGTGVPDVVN